MALDRIRGLKVESIAEGGQSADVDFNEVSIGQDFYDGQGITLQVSGATVNTADATTYISRPTAAQVAFTDIASGTLTLEQLLTSVGGKPGSHASTPDIIHYLAGGGPGDGFASGMHQQVVSTGVLPISVTWYTSSALTTKLYGVTYTYSGVLVTTAVQVLYSSNVAVRTVTDTFNYSANVFAPTITRTWS